MIPGVMEPWQAQVYLLVVNLAPCLDEHMLTIKADGMRLGLGKNRGPSHPSPGLVPKLCVTVFRNKDTASKCGHTGLFGTKVSSPQGDKQRQSH